MKNIMLRIAVLGTMAILVACSAQKVDKTLLDSQGTAADNSGSLVGKVQMSLLDSSGATLYSDAAPGGALNLRAGTNYRVCLDAAGYPAGTTFSLKTTNVSVVAGVPSIVALNAGCNNFTVPAQGDYAWNLSITAPGKVAVTQSYQASVSCASPTFTAASLNANAISVAKAGSENLYNYASAGVTAGANGQAPYLCAWDPTGVGIVDSVFQDCAIPLNNFYSDLVFGRNVGLVVKDSCNIAHTVSKPSSLPYTEPAMPGNVFIFGRTSVPTETPDPRYDGVTYLATNNAVKKPVESMYNNGSFTIESSLNYQMPSSVNHGVRIQLRGLVETVPVDPIAGTGSISSAGAFIQSISYSTDQAGDQLPQASLSAPAERCTYTCVNPVNGSCARVLPTNGTPCSPNQTGTGKAVTVEVWGHYRCNSMSGVAHGVDIEGDFDGFDTIVDSCVGGGQGQGGVPPPSF